MNIQIKPDTPITCDICGQVKTEFCDECQRTVAYEDGLMVDICSDCCTCKPVVPVEFYEFQQVTGDYR